jgi:hypothetical protein
MDRYDASGTHLFLTLLTTAALFTVIALEYITWNEYRQPVENQERLFTDGN